MRRMEPGMTTIETPSVEVVFAPSGRRGAVDVGTTVLDAARLLGVDLDSVCGGRGVCGRCQVIPQSHGNVSEWSTTEAEYRGRRVLSGDARLGCHTRITGAGIIDVPLESQVHRPVIRKTVDVEGLVVDPVVRLYYLELDAPDLGDDRSDFRRLSAALSETFEVSVASIDLSPLTSLQPALNANDRRSITVAVHDGVAIIGVWPGYVDAVFGVGVDVGSTTIAGHLCDLATGEVVASAGVMNPQIRFGEDLMSRVSYVMMHPGGERELTGAVRVALDELVGELCDQAAVERDMVVDMVVVGNPIMHHLVLGIDPTPLGVAPFTLATDLPVDQRAVDIDVQCRFARLHLLPCIAGHVGADTAAVILAQGPHRSTDVTLLIDVGTNAEIVLGNCDGLLAASSPTGPAFEGAQISCGQRATAGAIERVRIDRETLEPTLSVIGDSPITGVCGSGIIEAICELRLSGVITTDGTIDGKHAIRSARVVADGRTFAYVLHEDNPRLLITQNDVRAIQLAKAALYAGVKLLMNRAGIEAVDRVGLAGAFGSHIDPLYALVLGMIPDCEPSSVVSVGNAAGSGAVRALVSGEARAEIAAVARTITKIETAIEPEFQALFVGAMGIPHADDPYLLLGRVVDLPTPTTSTASSGRTRRRTRSTQLEET